MFRLSVGRRLGLIIVVVLAAITLLVMFVLRGQSDDALGRAQDHVESLAAPTAAFIESELASELVPNTCLRLRV